MENKKLLRYILKDLLELEEMFAEKTSLQFDEIETEFIQNRVTSARKLIQMYIVSHEEVSDQQKNLKIEPENSFEVKKPESTVGNYETNSEQPGKKTVSANVTTPVVVVEEGIEDAEPKKIEKEDIKPKTNIKTTEHQPVSGVIVNEILEYIEETITEIASEEGGKMPESEDEDEWQQPEPVKPVQTKKEEVVQQEISLEEVSADDQQSKRLGDSFSKEKSVNDLISADSQKLETKISNMPVSSIQTAIGINDRFQYIRELFDGDAEKYAETVTKLDSLSDLKEAVVYLQQNFKWKKTDVSLKFVTLIKRRFPQ